MCREGWEADALGCLYLLKKSGSPGKERGEIDHSMRSSGPKRLSFATSCGSRSNRVDNCCPTLPAFLCQARYRVLCRFARFIPGIMAGAAHGIAGIEGISREYRQCARETRWTALPVSVVVVLATG